jgi:hypothetical protein
MAIPDRTADLGSPSASFSGVFVSPTPNGSCCGRAAMRASWSSSRRARWKYGLNALAVSKPSNITDPYNADDDDDCTKLLGSVCTQSITKAISEGDVQQTIFIGCEDTIGINGFSAGGSKPCSPPYHQHQANL